MVREQLIACVAAMAAGLAPAGWAGAPPVRPLPAGGVPVEVSARVPGLERKLGALSPESAEPYFLLGEEIAEESVGDPAARRLARELYALSIELALAAKAGAGGGGGVVAGGLERSACLALAAIAENDTERRWLVALARSLDQGAIVHRWEVSGPGAPAEDAALDLATVLGLVRAGEGRRAEQVLAKPGVTELLDRYHTMLMPYGQGDGAAQIRRYAGQWPLCPECSNRRVLVRGSDSGRVVLVCGTCDGNPGPRLSDEELVRQLRLESVLLSGIVRSWTAQVTTDLGAPLREPDLAEVGVTYGVSASRPLWRNGAWTAPGGGEIEGGNGPKKADPAGGPGAPSGRGGLGGSSES